jgi:predicted TIM-barrel fold metal-dependent hydrolase
LSWGSLLDPAPSAAALDQTLILQALRLFTSGLFDRFPDLKFVLGHLGETLPHFMWVKTKKVALRNRESMKPLMFVSRELPQPRMSPEFFPGVLSDEAVAA